MDDGKPPDKRQLEISESSTWEAEVSTNLSSTSAMSSVINREDTESKQTKRAKILIWTSELHKRFVDAVDQLGLMNANPEGIMKLMDVGGLLSYYDVETHLQAYKFSLQTMEDASAATPPAVGPVVDDFLMQREEMHLTGVEIPNAHQVFDKISRRPGASESIIFSSAPSQATASLSDPYHLFDYPWVLDYAPFCDVGETGAKFASLVKFVVNVKRWKKRVSARLLMPQLILDMNVGSGVPVCAPPSTMTYGKAKKVQLAWEVEAKLASLVKFVVNIKRWKKRATARLNLDNEVSKRVLDSGAFTTTSQKATRTSSRFKSLLKFVVIIIRWKNRALARQRRALIPLHGNQLGLQLVSRDFFIMSRQLQVLDLSKTCVTELPSSIGNMKCLCFLDLSNTLIKRLPETIDCLDTLHTLKLRNCLNLSTLPKGMRKLVNLRHLDFDVFCQLRSMPKGMGDLTNIQTLSAYLVGVEEGCTIRQIKNMNNLSGSFCISRLENVLTTKEAEEACLSNKSQLQKLELHWSDSQDEDVVGCEEVLSSLQPNTSLEELNISCYDGIELPSWICDPAFSNLISITLFNCENCLILPSLGQLPSLKHLNLVDFPKLKVIDPKFYGELGIGGYTGFPKLEKLSVENMFTLEEWSGIKSFAFPRLLNLTVKHCPKLYSLCTLSSLCSLEKLEISHCTKLTCPGKLPARVETCIIEDCPLISERLLHDRQTIVHIPHVWIDNMEILLG